MNNDPIHLTISIAQVAVLVLFLLALCFAPIIYLIFKSQKEAREFQERTDKHVAKINELLDIDDELGPVQVLNLNTIEQIKLPTEELKALYESMLEEALRENTPEGFRLAAILRDTLKEIE